MTAIVVCIAVLLIGGTAALLAISNRLRDEIAALVRTFDHTQRTLVPIVAAVRTDRDRLHDRLARLSEPGSDGLPSHR